MVSNTMYAPDADGGKLIATGDWHSLVKLRDASGGRLVFTKTLAEMLQERGLNFVAVSSGSTGSAFLLNPKAPQGIGALVNGGLDPQKRVAFPDRLNDAILRKFPAAPTAEGAAAVDWTERVLREHVLTELKPDVIFTWLTDPDGPQHEHGVGSPEARAGLHNSDRNLGLLLDALAAQERAAGAAARPTHVIVTSDHGFARHDRAVNLTRTLIDAGAKSSVKSDDVTVVSNGQSVLFHVKNRDEATIRKVVAALQANDAVDVIFTRAARTGSAAARGASGTGSPVAVGGGASGGAAPPASAGAVARHYRGPVQGWVPGTFALELAHAANEARGADVLCSLAWSAAPNGFGVAGSQTIHSESRAGTLTGEAAGHGGLNPWTVRNTLLLWGPSFKRGVTLDTPAGIVDVTPTLLSLIGVDPGVPLDGRVLDEAFHARPRAASATTNAKANAAEWHETVTVKQGDYEAAIHLSGVGGYWYVDEGTRLNRRRMTPKSAAALAEPGHAARQTARSPTRPAARPAAPTAASH